MDLTIHQAKSIRGTIEVPGDKSISHRALIFGSLCEGIVEITNFLESEDCLSTLKCLQDLGVPIERNGKQVTVQGVGKYGFKAPNKPLNVGNSGTTLRILPGMLAAQDFTSTLVGDESVSKRPMDRIVKPLTLMGANIRSFHGKAPLTIKPSNLSPIDYQLPVASAQVKSAILLAGLFAEGKTTVSEKVKSRDHTERMLSYLGADIEESNNNYTINGYSKLVPRSLKVPGDISSAAFFIVASILLNVTSLTIKEVGLNPTRIGLLKVLENAGIVIEKNNLNLVNNEPTADLLISNHISQISTAKPFRINADDIPSLVDEIPILTVAATQIKGTSVISGAQELRLKESDRLKVMTAQLRRMGAEIEEKPDGLIINGGTKLIGSEVESSGDHRIAMSLAIAALVAEGQTVIKGAESIDISFPDFADMLKSVIG